MFIRTFMSNSDPQGLRWLRIGWLENSIWLHLNSAFSLLPDFGIISVGLYNLLQSVQMANVFETFLISNSFLAIYAVDGNSLNRTELIFFSTRSKNPINELIATSESLNLSWYLKIQIRIYGSFISTFSILSESKLRL